MNKSYEKKKTEKKTIPDPFLKKETIRPNPCSWPHVLSNCMMNQAHSAHCELFNDARAHHCCVLLHSNKASGAQAAYLKI